MLNFNVAAEDSSSLLFYNNNNKKALKKYSIGFYSFVFIIVALQAAQGQIFVQKKLARATLLGLGSVYKINVIRPMEKKVRFIPKQARKVCKYQDFLLGLKKKKKAQDKRKQCRFVLTYTEKYP